LEKLGCIAVELPMLVIHHCETPSAPDCQLVA
jgi:hypothetical protein